jgi:hypothetical protein
LLTSSLDKASRRFCGAKPCGPHDEGHFLLSNLVGGDNICIADSANPGRWIPDEISEKSFLFQATADAESTPGRRSQIVTAHESDSESLRRFRSAFEPPSRLE